LNTYPEAQTWSASDGCYCTYVLNNLGDMPQMPSYVQPSVNDHTFDDTPNVVGWNGTENSTFQTMPAVKATTNPIFPAYIPCMANVEIDTCVVMVTGNQPLATFTLTQKIGIESFPTTAELDILPLAHPSPSYDSVALSLYSEAVRSLPPGCPVSMNPSGEWWDMAMNMVVDSAKGLGEMFFPEFTPLITAAGNAYTKYRESDNRARQKAVVRAPPKPKVNRQVVVYQQPRSGPRGQSKAELDSAFRQAAIPVANRKLILPAKKKKKRKPQKR